MKTIRFIAKAAVLALAMTCNVACNDDNEEGAAGVPSFPEEKTEAVQPGQETTLAFNANSNWALESNQLWCKFNNNQTTLTGEAGEQQVKVNVTDEMQSIAADTASISLTMGGTTKVIARIIRMGQALVITNENDSAYNSEKPALIAYNANGASAAFTFKGNFNWELNECPEWAEAEEGLPIKGNAGTEVQIHISVNKAYWPQALTDTLKFYMQGTDSYVAVPLQFDGMPEGTVVTDGINGGAFWWNVTADGTAYWKDGTMVSEETEQTPFPLSFTVLAKDNAYKIVKLEQNGNWMNVVEDEYSTFISLTDDAQGHVTISGFQPNTGAERVAYILAMPTAVYEEAKAQAQAAGGIYDGIILTDDGSDLNTNFEKYAVLACRQEAAGTSEGGFEVLFQGWQALECQQGDGGTGLGEFVANEYNVDQSQIYTVYTTAGARLTINPMLGIESWDGSNFSNTIAITFEGGEVNKDTWEAGMTQDETGFTVSMNANQSMILIFKGTDYLNKKALLINVQ